MTSSSSPGTGATSLVEGSRPTETTLAASAPVRSTLADWTNDDDDVNGFYGEKRERGGRKKKNKKKREAVPAAQDWDDIYDPSRPNNYDEYKHSDERIREIREWKDKLYAHRTKRRRTSDYTSDEDDDSRGRTNGKFTLMVLRIIRLIMLLAAFAPPTALNFAPPPPPDEAPATELPVSQPPAVDIDMDESADAVYARRMRMSQAHDQPPPPSPQIEDVEVPHPYRPVHPSSQDPPAPTLPTSRPSLGTLAAMQNAAVSRAPVRYNLPRAPADIPTSEAELEHMLEDEDEKDSTEHIADAPLTEDDDTPAPRSNRPGQAKFAERMMAKMGWTKGAGLGAKGEGITTALKVKLEKRKQKSDAEGGGFVGPGGKGTIVGGKKKAGMEEEGKYGAMSEVVVLHGMLGGMDVAHEIGEGLVQEIGEECGEKASSSDVSCLPFFANDRAVWQCRTRVHTAEQRCRLTSSLRQIRATPFSTTCSQCPRWKDF